MKKRKNITLEMSLKPFRNRDFDAVCAQVFRDWEPLLRNAEQASVLLWVSDGSEILAYTGNLDDRLEWAMYAGAASISRDADPITDPEGRGLHAAHYLYDEQPLDLTYHDLREIVAAFKRAGADRVGIPFDPGPEFAESPFKYKLHPEILAGDAFGTKALVCCYHHFHADPNAYAAFPNGIPEGMPVATFFGRQCTAFLADLGFDYLWLSNGFGFGSEPWRPTGVTFDGKEFHPENLDAGRENVVAFWRLFRKECGCRVETRGTNLTVGLDMATDGVDLAGVYDGNYDLLPPPNSPWAALDGNFGLEIAGYLSRIARLPRGEGFLFRFYIHDPWWMNSPWMDRYEGAPHDIYLPLSLCRIGKDGAIGTPDNLSLLTIDDTLGRMPQRCVLEPTAHLLAAYESAPDAAPPLVWAYPFDAYCAGHNLAKSYFEDRFMVGALNAGLPLAGVVDMGDVEACPGAILVAPVPMAGCETLLRHVEGGGKLILYGSVRDAEPELRAALGLSVAEPIAGELKIEGEVLEPDTCLYPKHIFVDALLSDGGMEAVATGRSKVLATVSDEAGNRRALCVSAQGGNLLWLRGRNDGLHMHREHPADAWYPVEILMRALLARFNWVISYEKPFAAAKNPVITISRHDNALWYNGYVPDTTVGIRLETPLGAPLLMGCETIPENGASVYHLPRAFHKECRAFIRQTEKSVVSCHELISVDIHTARRIELTGLKDAEVTLLPTLGAKANVLYNCKYPYMAGEQIDVEEIETALGPAIRLRHATGSVLLSDERLTRAEANRLKRPAFASYQGEAD